jgi:hypothetical protein
MTDEYIYPLYNTSGNPYGYFSSKKHIDQDKKKVILSCSGKLSPKYDDGYYGTWLAPIRWTFGEDYRNGWSAGNWDRHHCKPHQHR